MKTKKVKFLFLFFLIQFYAVAQVPLDLENAIDLLKENNTQLKVQQYESTLSEVELAGSSSGFMPDISISHTGFYTNDPLNVFGFRLQQKSVRQEDFNPELLNNPSGFQHFNTQFSIQQPLLNFDVFSARKALKEKIKAMDHKKQYVENMLIAELEKNYVNLQFLYEAKTVVEQGISTYEEFLRNTKNLEDQGYAKHSDVLMVEVELAEIKNKEIEIKNNITNLSEYLAWLMGEENSADYLPTTDLELKNTLENDFSSVENRSDILAMKSGVEAQQKQLKMNKNSLLPRLNAFGEFNYNDKNTLRFNTHSYIAGISLSWNIFDGNKTFNSIRKNKMEIEKAESELQLQIEQNNLELQKAKRDLSSAEAKLSSTKKAKKQAAEALRIIENRYEEGLEKTADLLLSQTTKLEKEVDYLEVIKTYNLLRIEIEFLTQNNN